MSPDSINDKCTTVVYLQGNIELVTMIPDSLDSRICNIYVNKYNYSWLIYRFYNDS